MDYPEQKKYQRHVSVHLAGRAGSFGEWFADMPRVGDHIDLGGKRGVARVVLVLWKTNPANMGDDADIWAVPVDKDELLARLER